MSITARSLTVNYTLKTAGEYMSSEEVWKDIEGWLYHQVSNKGRVRVLPGGTINRRLITEPELRKLYKTRGHVAIKRSFGDKHGYYMRSFYVHILELNAFVGPCPEGQECRHLNDIKDDNRLENLEWGTRGDNMRDRVVNGGGNQGVHHGMAKLTESKIIEIRNSRASQSELARKYNVSQSHISEIQNRRTWQHI